MKVDIDLTDTTGTVCVQMRCLSFAGDETAMEPALPVSALSTERPSTVGVVGEDSGSTGSVERMELFLRQETALSLQKPVEDIPTDQSFFDLGLTSIGITHLMQETNRLLDENLSPMVLFEYRDIESLAAYLAITYPARSAAPTVVSRLEGDAHPGEWREVHRKILTPLPRQTYFSGRLAPSLHEQTNATTIEAERIDKQVLGKVLWQDVSLDDSYEMVTL